MTLIDSRKLVGLFVDETNFGEGWDQGFVPKTKNSRMTVYLLRMIMSTTQFFVWNTCSFQSQPVPVVTGFDVWQLTRDQFNDE